MDTRRAPKRSAVRTIIGALAVALSAMALTAAAPGASSAQPVAPPPALSHPAYRATVAGGPGTRTAIRSWQVQTSARLEDGGAAISRSSYDATRWYVAPARSTVMAALLADQVFSAARLFHSANLSREVDPRMFQVPWWYRSTFVIPAGGVGRTVLRADGIIPGADVWVNGTEVASRSRVDGAYTVNDIDVTSVVHPGRNVVAFEVPPADPERDLSIGWVDWNQWPPDDNMGIWRDVEVVRTGDVSLSSPLVTADLSLPSRASADVTVTVTAANHSASPRRVTIAGRVRGPGVVVPFRRTLTLAAHESRPVTFDHRTTATLHLVHPAVWWPVGEGAQPLYTASVVARTHDVTGSLTESVTDTASTSFGVRDVSSHVMPGGGRQFVVNGRAVQIRGGGWAPDLFLRDRPARTAVELGYVVDLGLNAVRLEGKLENPEFFEQADRDGVLVLPGWECCDKWEAWAGTGGQPWSAHDATVAARSASSEAVLLRDHPSVIGFMIGSDNAPTEAVARRYVDAFRAAGWDTPIIASAAEQGDGPAGASGMKMNGPYAWVPPSYWYDTAGYLGGAVGFDSETSAGEDIPALSDLRRFLSPADLHDLWSSPSTPQYHSGRSGTRFQKLTIFDRALAARYGRPASLADYVRKARLAAYEATRAQFEAFGSRATARRPATGVIYWMLDSAWPSLHWNLFDYYLHQGGAYSAVKLADQPVHVQDDYAGHVQVVNHLTRAVTGPLTVDARVRTLTGRTVLDRMATVRRVGPRGCVSALTLPTRAPSSTYFVELTLTGPQGRTVSRNVYWLSAHPDVLDPDADHTTWFYTPTIRDADLTGLQTLGRARVDSIEHTSHRGAQTVVTVSLRNVSALPAVDVQLALNAGAAGPEVEPVRWTGNDVTLFPGERETITATVPTADLHGLHPALTVDGFNLD